MALPTVEDVARAAGVSRQTVSNVLNSPHIVRDSTRERVEKAIGDLNYRPHASARRLRTRKSGTIGVRMDRVLDGISGSLLDRFLHAVTEQADARGMRILLYTAKSPEEEIERIGRLRDGADVDAFVLTSTFYGDPRTAWLIEQAVPFVTFGRPWGVDDRNDPQHLWVDVDGAAGLAQATAHLADSGCSRIGFLGWPSGSATGDDRRSGWERVHRERFPDTPLLAASSEDDVQQARIAAIEFLRATPELDGLVCVSDSLALGASMAAVAVGRPSLPIVGFDNTPVAAAVGLPSIEQDLDAVAAGALELLLGERGDDVVHRSLAPGEAHRLIEPHLVLRTPLHHPAD
ncbi:MULTISPECIES: LacI family DNA-binding transcriptional regulator [unclassified Rathayibacter]|uniref:LacI family DNA-binding transcriptional regulator n=1 Tax=unclassified Rathayibacter TaxID=2609250 RepID=UPI000CE7B7D2|nr:MULTISPECIES: LacI family DNA-binding transcriptional regulator [unclassified Rathayibacter]PPG07136.1 LacI family transcriptional regulator [Rathayibacter sp. AY2B1]PPG69367.1 LacI family transcriptional regulator [Rathayibacter sp. AY1F4]